MTADERQLAVDSIFLAMKRLVRPKAYAELTYYFNSVSAVFNDQVEAARAAFTPRPERRRHDSTCSFLLGIWSRRADLNRGPADYESADVRDPRWSEMLRRAQTLGNRAPA
jgi:hypothetical protein